MQNLSSHTKITVSFIDYYYYIRGLRVFSRCEDVAKKNEVQEELLVWTVGNGDPMHEACIRHSISRAWKQQE